jgi:hypothetical protein
MTPFVAMARDLGRLASWMDEEDARALYPFIYFPCRMA